MKRVFCELESLSSVAFCKPSQEKKNQNESMEDFERRVWVERCHVNGNNELEIPGIMFKKSLESASKFLNMKIKGEGNSTYTKNFKAGIAITSPVALGVKKENIKGDWQYVPSDGKVGGSSRVYKCFPQVDKWNGALEVVILDDKITEDVFKKTLDAAGMFIGVGRFRPINGGDKGRFKVTSVKFENIVV